MNSESSSGSYTSKIIICLAKIYPFVFHPGFFYFQSPIDRLGPPTTWHVAVLAEPTDFGWGHPSHVAQQARVLRNENGNVFGLLTKVWFFCKSTRSTLWVGKVANNLANEMRRKLSCPNNAFGWFPANFRFWHEISWRKREYLFR